MIIDSKPGGLSFETWETPRAKSHRPFGGCPLLAGLCIPTSVGGQAFNHYRSVVAFMIPMNDISHGQHGQLAFKLAPPVSRFSTSTAKSFYRRTKRQAPTLVPSETAGPGERQTFVETYARMRLGGEVASRDIVLRSKE